ncbi:Zinc finger, CCHC-type [Sesbania bispinosa]|nr:Zinc finger, CCHC-type [Sesbania bispinosa]
MTRTQYQIPSTISLLNALSGIWCNPKGFRLEERDPKTFQFFFDEEADVDRILRGNPWLFRNSWLNLRKWKRDLRLEEIDFGVVETRVQIWGLPPHCRTSKMGEKIGACLGPVKEAEVYENKERGQFVKVLVELNTTKPLLPGIPVGSKKDGITWVDFRYEKLPQFCYKCGEIGHEEDMCKHEVEQGSVDESPEHELGPWIRATHFGRKIGMRTKESNQNTNAKPKKPSFPRELTDMLASLSVDKGDTYSSVKSGPTQIIDKAVESIEANKNPITPTPLFPDESKGHTEDSAFPSKPPNNNENTDPNIPPLPLSRVTNTIDSPSTET